MNDIVSRQPQGIPTGGQFAATAHAEPQITLPAGTGSIGELIAVRDDVRQRRDEAQEEYRYLDLLSQRHSARGLAASILARYPTAAVLRVAENQDGENQYDPISITTADGTTLEHVDENDEWTTHEMCENGPQIEEFVWDFDTRDDRWAHGIGEMSGNRKYGSRVVDIDLHQALNAPLPDRQSGFEH